MYAGSSRISTASGWARSPSRVSASAAVIPPRRSCAKPAIPASCVRRATCWSTSCCSCAAAASTASRPKPRWTRQRSKAPSPATTNSTRAAPTMRRRCGNCARAAAARRLDVIDTAPPFTRGDAVAMERRFAGVATGDMLGELLTGELKGRVATVSSFGAESAVLLHMISQIDRDIPVIFLNTQKLFGETLAYRDELSERLGLTDLRVFRPDPRILADKDANGLRWSYDPDGCCDLRKVQPLRRALAPFAAWISGRKGFQAGTRKAMPRFEEDDGRLKLNPLADWDKARLDAWFEEHKLPRHPQEGHGSQSIGCAPSTSKVLHGEAPRAGRSTRWEKLQKSIQVPQKTGE